MKLLKKEDTLILLSDYQTGILQFCANRSHELILSRAKALARLSKEFDIPAILTTNQEESGLGMLIDDLHDLIPEACRSRIRRCGILNPWDDIQYREAVVRVSNGRKNVIMAGLTNDVSIVWSSISIKQAGFNVRVVIDAGGSLTQVADDIAKQTWEHEGVQTTSIGQLMAEFVYTLESIDGHKAISIFFEELMPSLGKIDLTKTQ